jgi:hypothetical protein
MSLDLSGASCSVEHYRRDALAARVLWREGLVSECHVFMVSALRALLEAWVPADANSTTTSNEDHAREQAALEALTAASYPDVARLRAALEAGSSETHPRDLRPRPLEAPDLDWIWTEAERLFRFTSRRLTGPPTRKRTLRRAGAVLGGALIALLLILALLWGRPTISASATYSSEHAATNAIDGIESTEWLLPDSSLGWLDLKFPWPRRVRRVQLLNSHNRYYFDRATQRVRVTAFSHERTVASVEGSFTQLTGERSPLELKLDAQRVTRLRVDVLSFFKNGGGLAEIEVR